MGIETPTPNVSGGDIPEPFNQNDEKVWIDRILKHMCKNHNRRCFYPSEFILNDEMQDARVYDNPIEREAALSDEGKPYYKIAKHSSERLENLHIVKRETKQDAADNNREYIVYCRTELLDKVVCPKVNAYPDQLHNIDVILEKHQRNGQDRQRQ
ncbi:MAG TPA: hypothetical protein VE076_00300 [Nitrososphaeraceae archaeon]|nr:hypothetical protein [Nitrososphaeraceae archaeon]